MSTKPDRNTVLVNRLKDKIEKEKENYRLECHEDRNRLSRTMYFTSERKKVRILRRIEALKLAIDVVGKPLREIDVEAAVINCIPPGREDFDDLADKARSIYLRERAQALKAIFEDILPICRKEMLREIEHYLPQTTTTPCNPSYRIPSAGTTAATTTGETAPAF